MSPWSCSTTWIRDVFDDPVELEAVAQSNTRLVVVIVVAIEYPNDCDYDNDNDNDRDDGLERGFPERGVKGRAPWIRFAHFAFNCGPTTLCQTTSSTGIVPAAMTRPLRPDRNRAALLVVDMQPDFMPGGPLPVAASDAADIIAPVHALMVSDVIPQQVLTQDWHPPGHVSFASTHPGKRPFDRIELYGREQTLWPDHCVQGSAGAAIAPDIDLARVRAILRKGDDPLCDSYSAFLNNWNAAGERPPTGLAGYLRERGIDTIYCCGLARDYCVKWSAEDAAAKGFRVRVVWDLTWPVDPGSDDAVLEDLTQARVEIVHAADLLR
jgi:nicotinamidase/pyrazinamidase